MSEEHEEIGRFSSNGKTFFFNKGEAKNGNEYLAINALWGQGNMEQMMVFPNQMFDFRRHLDEAIEEITGFQPSDDTGVDRCPSCDTGKEGWVPYSAYIEEEDRFVWLLHCDSCRSVIFSSEENDADAIDLIEEAENGRV